MRSPDHPVERDLDVADLRRPPPIGSVKRGHGSTRGGSGMRRYIVGGMVVVVLGLFSAVVWFAYQDLMPSDAAPPLIRADAGELKREPDERGGLPVVNAESAIVQALDEPESPVRVERILPRETAAPRSTADVIPEALAAEPGAALDPAAAFDPEVLGAEAGEAAGPSPAPDTLDTLLAEIVENPAALGAIEPAAGPISEDEIAGSDSLPLPADGLTLPQTAAETAAELTASPAMPDAPATPNTAATNSATPAQPSDLPATVAAAAPTAPSASTSTAPDATSSAASPAEAAVAPSAGAATPAAASAPAERSAEVTGEVTVAALPSPVLAPTFNGAFRVQLLAVQDEAAAAGAWAGLQQRFPDALGPLRSQVQRAEIGGDTFYRLHAGPFADRAGAFAVCEALQARGADCFVVAPTS